jgi:hypothetical protein
MLDPVQDLTQSINRARRRRGLPAKVIDPARVQAQLDAYLLERGRTVAEGQDLGQVSDQDLTTLGYLDAIAQHPTLSPGLAATLEMVGDRRHPGLAQAQHELDHRLRQVHDHGRLRETGVDVDQDHDRVQLMGLDPAAPGPADADGNDPVAGPRSGQPLGPRSEGSERQNGGPRGQGDTASRSNGKRGRKRNILDEAMDDHQFPEDGQ